MASRKNITVGAYSTHETRTKSAVHIISTEPRRTKPHQDTTWMEGLWSSRYYTIMQESGHAVTLTCRQAPNSLRCSRAGGAGGVIVLVADRPQSTAQNKATEADH